jgi:hypothetical protein
LRTVSITLAGRSEAHAAEWDEFVQERSRNGIIFHEQKFLGYHAAGRFVDRSLVFRVGAHLHGVLPAAEIREADGSITIVSHPGSSAGGLVYHRHATLREVLEMLELALDHYRAEGATAFELRLAEPIFAAPVDGELPFVLWHRGFRLRTREISSCVPLDFTDRWVEFGREKNPGTIRALQKKGVVAERTDDVDLVYTLIERNLDQRYQKHPTHTREEFAELKRRYPTCMDLWIVRVDGEAVATCVLFQAGRGTLHDFYIAQNYAHAKLNVMPLLFYTAFTHYQRAGFRWFNFGISSRGDWIKWGILEFKERMGGRATLRDVWRLDDLANYQHYQENALS